MDVKKFIKKWRAKNTFNSPSSTRTIYLKGGSIVADEYLLTHITKRNKGKEEEYDEAIFYRWLHYDTYSKLVESGSCKVEEIIDVK